MTDRRWAMLVGANAYEFFRPLKYAGVDALEFRTALQTHLGFTEATTLLLTDIDATDSYRAPTRNGILHTLALLGNPTSTLYGDRNIAPIADDDLFVFYFSGHGVRTETGDEFLLSLDTSDVIVTDTALSLQDLIQRIDALPCRHKVLFLDACRAELDEDDGGKAPGLSPGVGLTTLERPGFATFYACDPKGRSYEIDDHDIRHGSFTYCLLQAVEDPSVRTLAELNDYLASRVPTLNAARKKRVQQPFFVPTPQDMSNLDLFVFRKRDDLTAMREQITAKVEADVIDIDWWERIASFLQDVEAGKAHQEVLRMKILGDFLSEASTFEQFKDRWRLTEKWTRSVREAAPQVLTGPDD